jgi:hypothetical protein
LIQAPLFDKDVTNVDPTEFEGVPFNKALANIDRKNLSLAVDLDRYVFTLSKDKLFWVYYYVIPKQKVPFIPYFAKEKKVEDPLIEAIKDYFKITDKDFLKQKQIFDKLLSNPKIMHKYEVFFGLRRQLGKDKQIENRWF